jgi:4-methyl-5(b-hydroxyethyl)-thiazole monophosphate biosynthesis
MARVLVPLAPGFEEIEAVTLIDVLRRAGLEVVVAGLEGAREVTGSHGITVRADVAFEAVHGERFDVVALPGGEPGVTNLGKSEALAELLQQRHREGQRLAAICAAPRLLAQHGLLRGRQATSHPSVSEALRAGGARTEGDHRVVQDGHILTSRGPGTALEFSLALLEFLHYGDEAAALRRAMLVAPG